MKKKLTKKRVIIIIVIIALIVFVRMNQNTANKMTEETGLETEEIERRTIAKSVSATGTITTSNSKEIVSTLTGTEVATVNVVEGQKVAVGDVICTFDMASVKNNLSDAKSTANVSNAQSNLGIESAQRSLNEAVKSRDAQIVNAQREVASAQEAYNNVQNQLNSVNATISGKQAELATLDATIAQTQSALATAPETNPEAQTLTETLEALQAKKETLSAEIATLQASLQELQGSVGTLKAAYEAALAALNTTTLAADSNVAAMQDNLSNAQLSAKSSSIAQNSQVQTYQEQLEKGIVTSTVAGTVTSVNVKVGDLYGGSAIATIDGTDEFIVEAEIGEYDIADIAQGMNTFIKTDATKDAELKGQVSYVAVSPTTNALSTATGTTSASTNATYKIKITLNEQNERLRLGMNAKISIVLNSKENVWTVPYEAVQEREDETNYIEILKEGSETETQELNVQVGIEGTYYVEVISSELKDGMKVVLPKQDAGTAIEDLIQMEGPNVGV